MRHIATRTAVFISVCGTALIGDIPTISAAGLGDIFRATGGPEHDVMLSVSFLILVGLSIASAFYALLKKV